ncbi:DHHC palmitoyltransferase-domain-containing protein [Halenospora varia]|nr:DHHC palmitoyltransferase-domain-containing protein [Halenospora varia]
MAFFRITAIEDLAIPAVCILIFFLSYTSQFLFYYLEPGPLSLREALWFNGFVVAIWLCYDRACTVDPGPKGWVEKFAVVTAGGSKDEEEESDEKKSRKGVRWCKKCKTVKPPRAHHCKKCQRCIPKMDHHCPWTSNCVSHLTFPHFLRFVTYAVLSMSILSYHLYTRASTLWSSRNLPSYLGPPIWAIAHLLVLLLVNSITLFALSILWIHAIHSMCINTTMIENWEIERHEVVVERARKNGGYIQTNSGVKMRVEKQEFPYDVGVWKNLCQAMGTPNIVMWILPFGGGPNVKTAGTFEENGFEDEGKIWPPPDPEKFSSDNRHITTAHHVPIKWYDSVEDEIAAFKRRQEEDYQRRMERRDLNDDKSADGYESEVEEYEEGIDGEEGWTNSDGDRLRDYGVDEDAEDDIPLGELIRRRKAREYEEE